MLKHKIFVVKFINNNVTYMRNLLMIFAENRIRFSVVSLFHHVCICDDDIKADAPVCFPEGSN